VAEAARARIDILAHTRAEIDEMRASVDRFEARDAAHAGAGVTVDARESGKPLYCRALMQYEFSV
jgi:hypothetical protein